MWVVWGVASYVVGTVPAQMGEAVILRVFTPSPLHQASTQPAPSYSPSLFSM